MAGFGKVTFVGEYFNQTICNIFWYRSSEWLPFQGNPFDDVLAFVDAVVAELKTTYLGMLPTDYTLLRAEGIGYDDSLNVVTSSPLIRTINDTGDSPQLLGMGAAQCVNLGLRCGELWTINGTGENKRNRGYLAIGPVTDYWIDNYSHLIPAFATAVDAFAQHVDNPITVIAPAVVLTPVRIHQLRTFGFPTGTAYSDVLGYTLPRVASYRRSRKPEA